MPSTPGMRMSISTRSGRRCAIADRPSADAVDNPAVVALAVEEPAQRARDRRIVINDQNVCHVISCRPEERFSHACRAAGEASARCVPPWPSITALALTRPRPTPSGLVDTNGSNTRVTIPGSMPTPSSSTSMTKSAPSERVLTVNVPPVGHRVDGVDEDVGQHLRESFRIDHDLRKAIGQASARSAPSGG